MEKIAERSYKRRNYFIDKKFQANFIFKFCILVVIGGLVTIGLLYLLAMQSTTVSIVNSRVVVRTTADFILPILIQTVAIVTIMVSIATIIVTLLVSHKIAGPLYRFKTMIKTLEKGDFSSDFRIRHLDQLQDLSAALNSMIRAIRQELDQLNGNCKDLKEKLDSISDSDVPEYKRQALSDLKRISEELNKIVRYFKTQC